MSSQTHDFHSLFTVCRSRDCDSDNHCDECIDVDDALMTAYVKHRHGLKRRSLNKQCIKSKVTNPVLVDVESAPAVADLSSPSRFPSISPKHSISEDVAIEKDLFASLFELLEASFCMINNRISQAMSSAYNIDNRNTSQNVITDASSFSAAPIVAGRRLLSLHLIRLSLYRTLTAWAPLMCNPLSS